MQLSRTADYIVLEGRFLIAEVLEREGRSIIANLYVNQGDFVSDHAMERQVGLRFSLPRGSRDCCPRAHRH